jgi:hypothetical protein
VFTRLRPKASLGQATLAKAKKTPAEAKKKFAPATRAPEDKSEKQLQAAKVNRAMLDEFNAMPPQDKTVVLQDILRHSTIKHLPGLELQIMALMHERKRTLTH